jgi:tight adherence protein B
MTPGQLNFWTLVVFVLALLGGWQLLKWRELRRNGPQKQAAARLSALLNEGESSQAKESLLVDRALFQEYAASGNALSIWLSRRRQRLINVCGSRLRSFILVISVLVAVSEGLLIWMLPLAGWLARMVLLLDPMLMLTIGYLWAEGRYKKDFLQMFPDALDLIIRAVRAGVPANQAISAVGKEFSDPLRTEFSQMGDALRLGIDLKDVLNDAEQRIGVPEFSFFSVCLLLQRETGGQLTETLENLAQIIRARRDLVLKARALTAESRMASLFIAAVPFLLLGGLWFLSHDYILPLFVTESGLFMLKLALGLIIVGLSLIYWISNLKV